MKFQKENPKGMIIEMPYVFVFMHSGVGSAS